jgi:aminoglycoside 3-N-acetyltransferase
MGEADAIAASDVPATVATLRADLAALGDLTGQVVLVHSSLSALGFVVGGAQAVVEALLAWLGPRGTLVVPTFSTHLSDPARWAAPPVPEAWWQIIRDQTPAFDPDLTPTREMGVIADTVRAHPQARRSAHPMHSFAAIGPAAEQIVGHHDLEFGLTEGSPLVPLLGLDAWVLLLGVGHANNTSLHLAEHRAGLSGQQVIRQGSPVLVDGRRRWVTYDELDVDAEDFTELGAAFAATGRQRDGRVAAGRGTLMRQRELVDVAIPWLREHRRG